MGSEIDLDKSKSLRHAGFISASIQKMLIGKILKQVQDDVLRMPLLFVFIALFLFVPVKTFAQEVPQTIVRVAISDTGFKTTGHKELSVFAQDDYYIYDKTTCTRLAKLSAADILNVKINSGSLEAKVGDKVITKQQTPIVIDCPKALLGVQNLKRNGKQALYHGYFEICPKAENQFYLINVIEVESYLRGVVPNEMPVRFGLEALKAQAIAARNYVLMPRTKGKDFDVDDSVASQVYFGAATESPLSNQAVKETQGLVALHGWDLILAQYSSTAGGYTESYENAFSDPKSGEFPAKTKPYLVGRPDMYSVTPLNREEEARIFYMSTPDSYDMKSPYYRWQKQWDVKELEEVLSKTLPVQSKTGFVKPKFEQGQEFGELKELKVVKRGVSGKVMELEIHTDKGCWTLQKELVIRRALPKSGISLPSANVVFDNLYDSNKKLSKIVAYGGGFGHGVGMSQFGAGFMAMSLNKSFDKILKRYYSGITISTIPVILSSCDNQNQISQKFWAPKKKATLVIDDKFNIQKLSLNLNGQVVEFELEKTLLPSGRLKRLDISKYIKEGENTVTFFYPTQSGDKKGIRLYIELVEKDDNYYNF